MPGAFAVSANRRLARARNVDLPTLGRPTRATTGRRSTVGACGRARVRGVAGRGGHQAGSPARVERPRGDLGRHGRGQREPSPAELNDQRATERGTGRDHHHAPREQALALQLRAVRPVDAGHHPPPADGCLREREGIAIAGRRRDGSHEGGGDGRHAAQYKRSRRLAPRDKGR